MNWSTFVPISLLTYKKVLLECCDKSSAASQRSHSNFKMTSKKTVTSNSKNVVQADFSFVCVVVFGVEIQ